MIIIIILIMRKNKKLQVQFQQITEHYRFFIIKLKHSLIFSFIIFSISFLSYLELLKLSVKWVLYNDIK